LTAEMIRKFSRRAWQYILAYFSIEYERNIYEDRLHEINIVTEEKINYELFVRAASMSRIRRG
jgi:hypothetical protein